VNSPSSGLVKLSTGPVPERDRAEVMREVFGRAIMKLEFEPLPDIPLSMDKIFRSLPGCGISAGTNSAMNCIRTARLIDSDDFILTITLSGGGTVYAHDRETVISGGSATLARSGDPHRFNIHSISETISFRLGIDRIAPLIADMDSALNRRIPADSDALRALVNYAATLQREDTLETPEVRSLAATYLHDLAALAIGATRNAIAVANSRSVPAARLRAIKADIIENLSDRNLSTSTIGRRHGITSRYVSMLFDGDTMTFSEFLLAQRLNRAYRILIDPRHYYQTVSSVAYEAGFGDLSYFNRAFRRRYGTTPTEVREAAQTQ
jgi:AraC-like DNA-binding protein